MSYINMDHAGWVESNIAALKQHLTKGQLRKAREENRGWAAAPDKLNSFQTRAFNILGIVGGGIYNAPIAWDSVYWRSNMITCSWGYKGLGTWDFGELTRFVFLCHEARIRGYIGPLAHRYLEISLSERKATGSIAVRHPDLHEALVAWRNEFPADHSIVYRDQPIPEPAKGADPDQTTTGGVLIPSMVAAQAGEPEAGEVSVAGASAAATPALLAPAEPGGCEGGCGHAPEVNSKGEEAA